MRLRIIRTQLVTLMCVAAAVPVHAGVSAQKSTIAGVDLVGASDAGFNDALRIAFPDANSRAGLAPVLPVGVVLRNNGNRNVALYVIRYEYVSAGGRALATTSLIDNRGRNAVKIAPGAAAFDCFSHGWRRLLANPGSASAGTVPAEPTMNTGTSLSAALSHRSTLSFTMMESLRGLTRADTFPTLLPWTPHGSSCSPTCVPIQGTASLN